MIKKIFFIFLFLISIPFCLPSNASFEKKTDTNPFRQFNQENPIWASPAVGDFTEDGTIDALVGTDLGEINSFSYDATLQIFVERNSSPIYSQSGVSPDSTVIVKPTLIDWDQDDNGTLELFVCEHDSEDTGSGRILFFENDGSGNFSKDDAANPFSEISGLGICKVTFGEFSNQTDGLEAFVGIPDEAGGGFASVKYFTLNGSNKYVEVNPSPINYSVTDGEPKPFAIDFDKNGFTDIVLGLKPITIPIQVYLNGEDSSNPIFPSSNNTATIKDSSENPIAERYGDPVIVDINDDGLRELFIGSFSNGISYYEEIGSVPGDYDGLNGVDLADAILALQVVAGFTFETLETGNEISGDGAIGVEEAIFALQEVAGVVRE